MGIQQCPSYSLSCSLRFLDKQEVTLLFPEAKRNDMVSVCVGYDFVCDTKAELQIWLDMSGVICKGKVILPDLNP